MHKPVLIASSRIDAPHYEKVAGILEDNDYPVVIYETDKVLSGEDQFVAATTDQGDLVMSYNGTSIVPEALSAAWYRKIGSFDLPYQEDQIAKRLYINNEVRQLHDMIWSLYPSDLWLNAPENMARADRKFRQMQVAHEVGFTVLPTAISSDWLAIKELMLQSDDDRLAIKMLRGVTSDKDKLRVMYTNVADKQKVEALERSAFAFPAYYQPYAEKAREWRITVVGDKVFPAAIYTEEPAKDDWRRHQTVESVRFRKEKPPEDIDGKCVDYLGRMALRFGAFDFIEKPDGEIIFLECNPNGQYGWLEQELGLPISEEIASELMKLGASQ